MVFTQQKTLLHNRQCSGAKVCEISDAKIEDVCKYETRNVNKKKGKVHGNALTPFQGNRKNSYYYTLCMYAFCALNGCFLVLMWCDSVWCVCTKAKQKKNSLLK